MRIAAIFLFSIAVHLTAAEPSQWTQRAYSEMKNGLEIRPPNCHLLSHFTDPDSQLKELGSVKRHRVIQTLKRIEGDLVVIMKRLLVERTPGEFCLIYQQRDTPGEVEVTPAQLLTIDGEQILATRDRMSGTGAFYLEHYWAFDDVGPRWLDLTAIKNALKEILPNGHAVWKGYGFNIKSLCYRMPVWKDGDPNCCPTGGSVAVKLAIQQHQLVVTYRQFKPSEPTESADHCEP